MIYLITIQEVLFVKSRFNIKNIISSGCVINSVLILLVYVIGVTIDSGFIPTLQIVIGVLCYSLALAFANYLFFSSAMKTFPKLVLHFLSTAAVFYLMFVILGGYRANGGSVAVVLAMYLALYVIVALFTALVRYIINADKKAEQEYKKVFENKHSHSSRLGGKK